MQIKEIYLSAPNIQLANQSINNKEILNKVEENFKGDKSELKKIKFGISYVFKYCDTSIRYLGTESGLKPLDYAVKASENVCRQNDIDPLDIDLVIYGGIFRDYFEPATAMEIASKLNIKSVHAFDVTNACAGLLQAVNVASAIMMADSTIKTALCCTTDFPDEAINYDIQSFEELSIKAAGLTLGSGAAAWLLTRKSVKSGSAKLLEIQNTSIPNAFGLCQVSVNDRKFKSSSKEIFDLGLKYVPGEITRLIQKLNWKIDEIDFFISHQPSKKIIHQICDVLKIDYKKAPITHHLYGNTINVSVPITLDYLIKLKKLQKGDKIIMSSAAAGFTMLTIGAEWVQ
jgi:3-oxoacyl-[acyl-carrier-protein] synthase III